MKNPWSFLLSTWNFTFFPRADEISFTSWMSFLDLFFSFSYEYNILFFRFVSCVTRLKLSWNGSSIVVSCFHIIWDRPNLFEGWSPIILRGRREKGMYFFFKYFLKFFFNYLSGVISLWLMAVLFILPTPLFRRVNN